MNFTENKTADEKSAGMSFIYRADADTEIGVGHVMRCVALAQASKKIGATGFIIRLPNEKIVQRLKSENFSIFEIDADRGSEDDVDATIEYARNFNADWLVLDGYQFGSKFQRRIYESGIKTLLIDDMGGGGPYWANLILNQNLHAGEELYDNRQPNTELLLGCQYALLRQEFAVWRNSQREIPLVARRILVTLGGGDHDNVTAKVIESFDYLKQWNLEVTVIAGPLNPHFNDLIEKASDTDIPIAVKSSIRNMPDHITQADIGITAAGSTCYEFAALATPFATIVLAQNQVEIANQFANRGISVNLGWYESITPQTVADHLIELIENQQRRSDMSLNAKRLVDGGGAERVVQEMLNREAII